MKKFKNQLKKVELAGSKFIVEGVKLLFVPIIPNEILPELNFTIMGVLITLLIALSYGEVMEYLGMYIR